MLLPSLYFLSHLMLACAVNACSRALCHYSDLSTTESTGGAIIDFWSSGEWGYVRIMVQMHVLSPRQLLSQSLVPLQVPFDYLLTLPRSTRRCPQILSEFQASCKRVRISEVPTLGCLPSCDHKSLGNLGCKTSDDPPSPWMHGRSFNSSFGGPA
ncbi:hypothetical protein C8R44DRAFT_860381 [Mycena epipterygia]|nr:hypothetical protein C8R44DRAFT_860381 [Mycena epipterygia]